jgi:hypothetical protein
VEVYPAYDPAEITAFLAANVAHELLSMIALQRASALDPAVGGDSVG